MQKKTRNPQKTRQKLLNSASEQMHEHGFQGMRVDKIIHNTDLQKGAFYHHFHGKNELGYAVLEEQITPLLQSIWIDPLSQINNPIDDFPKMLKKIFKNIPATILKHGCPLNNLAQEMASQDTEFQKRIVSLFETWIKAYQHLFETAQERGHVRKDIDAESIARFLISIIEGCISLYKAEQSSTQWLACQSQIDVYLKALKP